MKQLQILFIVLIIIANIGCSAHCDDEDYSTEQEEASLIYKDTLKAFID